MPFAAVRRSSLIVVCALAGWSGCATGARDLPPVPAANVEAASTTAPSISPPDVQALEATIRKAVDDGTIPSAAIAVARDDRIVYENAFGWADKEGHVAASIHTAYPLASATKPIVATGLMILAERGKVDLDAPALRYLQAAQDRSNTPAMRGTYTLRQLLNHTSGIGTYASIAWGPQAGTAPALLEHLRHYAFEAQRPGVVSEYSNLGYGIIGAVIAGRSGKSLPAFLADDVFIPLGMSDSRMVDSAAIPPGGARKYDAGGSALDPTYNDTPGAGNAWSSVHDLVRFGMFHLSDQAHGSGAILKPETKRLMRSFVGPDTVYPYYDHSFYGLGWYFRAEKGEPVLVWHEGGMPGASAILVLLPQERMVASVLINATDKNDLAHTWANQLLRSLDPAYTPATFEATDGMHPFAADAKFLGRWEGSVRIDGADLPCALTFTEGGKIHIEFPGRTGNDLLPAEATFGGLVSGDDYLLGTLPATLPARDVVQKPGGYVLFRLLVRGNQLAGTMVAFSSVARLEYLFPFKVTLTKKGP